LFNNNINIIYRVNQGALKKATVAQTRLKEEMTKVRNNMNYIKTQYTVNQKT
jgi:hypothetical protein